MRSLSLICSGLATPVNDFLLNAAAEEPKAAVDMMISGLRGLHAGTLPSQSQVTANGKQYFVMHPRIQAHAEHKLAAFKTSKTK